MLTQTTKGTVGTVLLDIAPALSGQEQPAVAEKNRVFSRAGSFASVMLDDKLNAGLMADLGYECGNFVKKIYMSGKTLASEALAKTAKPLSTIKFKSGVQDMEFFHYSKGQGLKDLLNPEEVDRDLAHKRALGDGSYEKMFLWYRTRQVDSWRMWRRVHYLAEDPESSKYLGSVNLRFFLNPAAKTITWDEAVWRQALNEIAKRYPGLQKACGTDLTIRVPDTFKTVYFNQLLFMISEDSGIDVVDFQTQEWFQLISPDSIASTRVSQ